MQKLHADTSKEKGFRRRVPLTVETANLLADNLASHPRATEPTAHLFPAVTLTPLKPTGKKRTPRPPDPPNRPGGINTDRSRATVTA